MLDHMLTADAMLRDANMGVLDKLKIVALAKQVKGTVEQERRNKLAEQLTEQLKLAEAALGGVAHQRTKAAWETDAEGNRYRVQRPVKLRHWWTVADGGVAQFGVRYGAVPLQLQPGKTAVEVAKLADLPAVNGRVKVSQWATQNVATLGSARLLHKRAPASGRPRLSQSWRLPGCFGP